MTLDESIVDRIIADMLRRHGATNAADPDIWEAQNALYDLRTYDPVLVGDENYAIAEHYMLSRALVAFGHAPVEQLLLDTPVSGEPPRHAAGPGSAAETPGSAADAPSGQALARRKIAEGARDGERQRLRNGRGKPPFNPKALAGYPAFRRLLAPTSSPPAAETETVPSRGRVWS